jgi:hypothetical protein
VLIGFVEGYVLLPFGLAAFLGEQPKSGFKVKQKSALPVTAPQDCFPIDKLLTVRNLELGAAKPNLAREIWDELERSCRADNVPRRDQDLSDEERDEMDRLRCATLSLILKALRRQSQKSEQRSPFCPSLRPKN